MNFLTAEKGRFAGELVRYEFTMGAPDIRRDRYAPRNPYPSGYGKKIPTPYRVRTIDQRWRRVYCVCYSNVGTLYIIQNGSRIIVDINQ